MLEVVVLLWITLFCAVGLATAFAFALLIAN
jgi:hypothetical protein